MPPLPWGTRRSSLGSRCPQLHPCHGTGSAHPSWAGGAVADGSVPQTRATEEVFVSSGVMKGCCCPNSAWIRARRSSQTRSQGSSCGAAACCLDPNAARNEGLCAQPAFSPPLPPAAVPGAAPMPPAPGSSWAAPVPSTPSPKFRPGDGLWGAEDNALLAVGAAWKDGRRCPAVATLIILHHPPSRGCLLCPGHQTFTCSLGATPGTLQKPTQLILLRLNVIAFVYKTHRGIKPSGGGGQSSKPPCPAVHSLQPALSHRGWAAALARARLSGRGSSHQPLAPKSPASLGSHPGQCWRPWHIGTQRRNLPRGMHGQVQRDAAGVGDLERHGADPARGCVRLWCGAALTPLFSAHSRGAGTSSEDLQ